MNILLAIAITYERMMCQAILHNQQALTSGMKSEKDAITALCNNVYDMVFVDLSSAHFDGIAVVEKIRDLSSPVRNHFIPIVGIFSHEPPEVLEDRCKTINIDQYLTLPINPEDVSKVLQSTIEENAISPLSHPKDRAPFNAVNKGKDRIIFNQAAFLERIMDDQDTASLLIKTFIHDVPELVDHLKSAILKMDASSIQHHAHTLKGVALNICAEQLAHTAYSIEQKIEIGQNPAGQSEIALLEQELTELIYVLKKKGNI